MTVLGHTIAWGTHIGDRHTAATQGWYASCKTWWANHKAAQLEANRAAVNARWDAQHEVIRPAYADSVALTFHVLGA
jgi:hypothetical protein